MQSCPAPQVWPQDPQLVVLLCRLKQDPSQSVSPGPHSSAQVPCEQTSPWVQSLRHAPQWLLSVSRNTHMPMHSVMPGEQTQVPEEQTRPPRQGVPHAPQEALLVCRSTQVPKQYVWPDGQEGASGTGGVAVLVVCTPVRATRARSPCGVPCSPVPDGEDTQPEATMNRTRTMAAKMVSAGEGALIRGNTSPSDKNAWYWTGEWPCRQIGVRADKRATRTTPHRFRNWCT